MAEQMTKSDDEPKCKVIDFAEQRLKRLGVAPKSGDPKQSPIKIDPGRDKIVGLAGEIIGAIDDAADEHPIKTLASLNLALATVRACYTQKYGEATATKIQEAAVRLSNKYKPVFVEEPKDDRSDK